MITITLTSLILSLVIITALEQEIYISSAIGFDNKFRLEALKSLDNLHCNSNSSTILFHDNHKLWSI